MKYNWVLCVTLLVFFTLPRQTSRRLSQLFAEEKKFGLTFSGSWNWNEEKETSVLADRVDASLFWRTFSFRAELLDKRLLSPWTPNSANTGLFMGIYHIPTASRLLYGALNEWGLPARIKNPWARTAPFAENHAPTVSDLITESSSKKLPSLHLYLKSAKIGAFSGFLSTSLDNEFNAALGSGISADFQDKKTLRLECFYTGKELQPRTAATWFSEEPPLPTRDFRIFGAGAVFSSPLFSLATDFANSETFAFGRGVYANIGVRFGGKTSRASLPWALSFASDGASDRYVGRNGVEPGEGFRYAAKFEYFGKNSALFRVGTTARAEYFGGDFERSSSELYYRFPMSRNAPIQFSRISFNIARNDLETPALNDYEAVAGLNLWKFRTFFSIGLSALSWSQEPFFYPLIDATNRWKSIKFSGDISYKLRFFLLSAKTGCLVKEEKEPLWNASFSYSLYGKHGRFTFKASSENLIDFFYDFENWLLTLSWRISL
ncbi:MAG: hypothetical protein LBG05_03890 [Treponema sp.]|jgi:hypothetical protein|nr:hypothetical protein [Treponema sp.]